MFYTYVHSSWFQMPNKKGENTIAYFYGFHLFFPSTSSYSETNFSLCFRNKVLFLMVREKKMKRLTLKSKCQSHAKQIQCLSSFHSSFFKSILQFGELIQYFQCPGLSRVVYEVHKEAKCLAHWTSTATLYLPQRTQEDFRKKITAPCG